MLKQLLVLFGHRWVIGLLLVINTGGTIYGYMWYANQLRSTPAHFLPFVPDSPTASFFFMFVLVAFLFKRNWPIFEALAAVTLIKYGIWAVVMNLATAWAGDTLQWQHYMLIASHGAMAVQAIIYSPYFRIRPWHLIVVAVWTLHNDIIDYVFMMHPWLSSSLIPYIEPIGYFTFWLSIASLLTVYLLSVRYQQMRLSVW